MTRVMLSRPVARALHDEIITQETEVLDYGCGRGGDLARLEQQGIACRGYDPVYRPDPVRDPADVVTLGYVLNVIEDRRERSSVLQAAWKLTRGTLVVAGRLEGEAPDIKATPHGDGVVTSKGTFQKFYTQATLRDYIEETLGCSTVAAAPGVFYVFREATAEQAFLARRVHRTIVGSSKIAFAEHEDLLDDLVTFFESRGRLPRKEECAAFAELEAALGSVRNAFRIIRNVTGDERWDRVRVARTDDLLVYLALSRFGRRPTISSLPSELQYDIKDLFGSYRAACEQADRLLYAIADSDRVTAAINAARVGKRTRDALYVHTSAVGELVPVLRVLDGCARALIGTAEETTLIKFRPDRPVLSYLAYPNFDKDPHPALQSAYVVDLQSLRLDFRDYSDYSNPPILHRKELFVAESHPHHARFARLTRAEARAGLYGDPSRIGTRAGWNETLEQHGVSVRGHKVVPKERRTATAPPERPRSSAY